jgi:DNA-binding MarR family transcriptional regulator
MAERLQIQHHSAVGLVDRLVTQGLLMREPDVEDRRQVYVALTSQGKESLGRLAVAHKQELRRLAPQLNQILANLIEEQKS